MHLLTAILPPEILQAICWTLIHSLWQGLIAAVVAALVITVTKRSAASLRYNLLLAVLMLFILAISMTAQRQLLSSANPAGQAIHTYATSNAFSATEVTTGRPGHTGAVQQNRMEWFKAFGNEHASVIVWVWFLICLIKCSQLLTGFHYIRRLRYRNNYDVPPYWKERLVQLATKTGIRRSIAFLESELVKVPAVIGFLKPVLLVPAGLLSHLPPEQVEAILIHELAHIHRKDFLVNCLQSFIETFFFFNPAIIWISHLIREEREACCDDMVIANIASKNSYLHALVSFHELQFHSQQGAMALTGNKHDLLNRVKRMLTLENKKLNLMEKTVLLLSVVAITAFSFMTREAKGNAVPATPLKKEIVQPIARELPVTTPLAGMEKPAVKEKKLRTMSLTRHDIDTVPKVNTKPNAERTFRSISSHVNNDGNSVISQLDATDDQGKNYRIKKVDGKITELSVDGTLIPENQYGDYEGLIRQLDESHRLRSAKQREDIAVRKALAKQSQEQRKQFAVAKQKELRQKMELRKQVQTENNVKRVQDRKLLEQRRQLQKAAYSQQRAAVLQRQKLYSQQKLLLVQNKKLYKQDRIQTLQHANLYNRKVAELAQEKSMLRQATNHDDIRRIIADLNHQRLVTGTDTLSFTLNDNELVINGKRQSSEIHRQFKEKYLHNNNDRFIYSRKGNQTSITINKE